MAIPFLNTCAAIHSIMVSKSRWGPLAAAGGAHYFSKAKKAFTSFARANNHATNSPPPGRYPRPPSTVFTRAHCRRT
eukprot:scaffold7642_cov80-Skeletonema_dohrnii-CCMP3373.AAC.2